MNIKKMSQWFVRMIWYGCLFLGIFVPSTGYAYLDPGNGSYLVQVIIAVLAAVPLFFTSFLRLPVKIFSRIFNKHKPPFEDKTPNCESPKSV